MSVHDLVAEVMTRPPPPRGKRPKNISATVTRLLQESDLHALASLQEGSLGAESRPLMKIRHSHHTLARLLADGMPAVQASAITGYSQSYISIIQADPAFKATIDYYREQKSEIYFDLHERLKALGIDAVEEIQSRLAENPDNLTTRELKELAEMVLDRTGFGPTTKIQSTVAMLTGEDLARLKSAVSARSVGTVRPLLTSSGRRSEVGPLIEHEPLAESAPEGGSGEGNNLSEEGRETSSEDAA